MSTDREGRGADPRVERSRQVILAAALGELGEAGYGAFTIESVAARAGVAKSTIYRHWPDKITLIADAFETFKRSDEGRTLYRLRDGSPDWMTQPCHKAHADMLPDDWRYSFIQ